VRHLARHGSESIYCAVLWFGFSERVRKLFDMAKAIRHRHGQITPE
jgi:hypothetical protein